MRNDEGVHKELILQDSRFHGNDNNGCFLTSYEFVKFEIGKNSRM